MSNVRLKQVPLTLLQNILPVVCGQEFPQGRGDVANNTKQALLLICPVTSQTQNTTNAILKFIFREEYITLRLNKNRLSFRRLFKITL